MTDKLQERKRKGNFSYFSECQIVRQETEGPWKAGPKVSLQSICLHSGQALSHVELLAGQGSILTFPPFLSLHYLNQCVGFIDPRLFFSSLLYRIKHHWSLLQRNRLSSFYETVSFK